MAILALARAACRARGQSKRARALGDAEDDFAVDELLLAASRVAKSGGCQAVDLAQGALGELVEGGEGVVGEEVRARIRRALSRKRTYSAVSSTVAGASRKR